MKKWISKWTHEYFKVLSVFETITCTVEWWEWARFGLGDLAGERVTSQFLRTESSWKFAFKSGAWSIKVQSVIPPSRSSNKNRARHCGPCLWCQHKGELRQKDCCEFTSNLGYKQRRYIKKEKKNTGNEIIALYSNFLTVEESQS